MYPVPLRPFNVQSTATPRKAAHKVEILTMKNRLQAFACFLPLAVAAGTGGATNNKQKESASSQATFDPFWAGGPFCTYPNDKADVDVTTCRQSSSKFQQLSTDKDVTFYDRNLTGECGPQCRPSCVTLMLDLDKLDLVNDLKCKADELCQCEFEKCHECDEAALSFLHWEHPKCFLEEADCLGATVFDDVVAIYETATVNLDLPSQEHCTSIPDGDLYCRFQDWKLITPIEDFTCDGDCVKRDRKIYWEYCNIVEEEDCDRTKSKDDVLCLDEKCGTNCRKATEPFEPGWTSFTVTASIPLRGTTLSNQCLQQAPYSHATDRACFLQRIDIYYPELDEDCGHGCPHCHKCPLLSLGDKFGPLEVVGFGHCLDDDNDKEHQHECAACDRRDEKLCGKSCEVDCLDLESCYESSNCYEGHSLGVPSFFNNGCSFCGSTNPW